MPVHPLQLSRLRHRIFNRSHNSRFSRPGANRAATVAAALTLTLTLAACGDTPGSIAAPEPPPFANPGLLIVEMRGLPAGLESSALVSGPDGFQQRVAGTDTLQGLKPGTYTVTAAPVPSGQGEWQPSQESQSVQINGGIRPQAIIISFDALIRRAQLSLDIEGLPTGVAAKLQLSKPNGRMEQPANSTTYDFAPLGNWTLDAFPVSVGAAEFTPVPASQTRVLRERDALKLPVRYSATRGGVAVAIVGLPSGQSGKVSLSGVNGFSRTLSSTATVTGLEAGSYQLSAQEVTVGDKTYSPSPASSSFQLVPNPVATAVTVSYTLKEEPRGALSVSVGGLPSGQPASITVTGPDGYSKAVVGSTTLSGLKPGSYTITATSVAAGGLNYSPSPASRTVSVSASGSPASASVAYAAQTGSFKLTLSGLPGGTQGDLTLAGPGGYGETLSAGATLSGLPVGSYTLTARAVQAAGNSYAPNPASKTLSITTGSTTSQTVTYALASGSLAVSVSGLPSGTNAAVSVSGPGGYSKSVSSTTTLSGLEPGSYTVAASSVSAGAVSYAPSPATRSVSVTASATAATAAVSYTAQTGSFKLTLSGLPAGASGDLTLTGPGGYSKHLSAATTLSGLAVGSYTLTASSVSTSSGVYAPSPASKSISITTGNTTSQTVAYALASGSLAVSVSGLPSGTGASISVTGPGGYSKSLSSTTTLSGLEPGSYTVAASSVSEGGVSYAPSPATRSVSVTASTTAATAAVSYTAQTGSFKLTLSGLPAGASGDLTLTGPGGYSKHLSAATTLSGLAVGSYTLTASSVSTSSGVYAPSPASKSISITSGNTTSQSVSYSALQAVLKIPVSGLPGGATANITLTDPQGQTRSITATTTLNPAASGRWRLTAQQVSTGSNIYAPSPASYDQTVLAGDTMSYPVSYTLASGSIAVSVSGLPAGAGANISVSGPGGYSKTVTSTATLTGLTPGSYTVTAGSVSAGGNTFNATPATRSVNVTASTVAQAAPVTYTQVNNGDGGGGGGNTPNLSIENLYLIQAAQNWEGTTPIVQGREALARVFVKAAAANTATPVVKLSIYSGSSLVSTINIPAAASSVPTAISEGSMSASWNVVIPAASVRANMQVRAELDPGNTLGESDRSDNLWPRGGGLSAVNIINPPPLSLKFVPVTVAGLTGNVTEANKEAWMEMMKQVYPLREVDASVRAPYVSNAGAFQSSDGNGSWSRVLSEVNVLRATDGVGSSITHYFGVVKTSYGSGIAGIGYQPGRTAIGWDQSATYQRVFAHEIGHNFALGHAPCGVSGSSMYPYSGGKINVWGWNSRTNSLVPPSETDLMGYCSNQWISDWTISQVAARRAYTGGMIASAARTEGLLIWGRSGGAGQGAGAGAVLEPAFPVLAAPTGEPLNASHIAELYDAAGGLVASYRFEMEAVDHSTGEGQFATVVPLSAALQSQVSSIAIRAVGSPIPMAVQRSGASSLAAARGISEAQAVELSLPAASVRAGAGGRSVVEWNNSVFRMAMVRDRNTGEILSFLRQPGDEFQAGGRPVEIVFSDGTRNRVERR